MVVEEEEEEEITTILGITQDNSPTTAPWREITLEEETQDLTEVGMALGAVVAGATGPGGINRWVRLW